MTERPDCIINALDWETIWLRHQAMKEMPFNLKEWLRPYLLEDLEVPVDENGIIYAGDYSRRFKEEELKQRKPTLIQVIQRTLDVFIHF